VWPAREEWQLQIDDRREPAGSFSLLNYATISLIQLICFLAMEVPHCATYFAILCFSGQNTESGKAENINDFTGV